MKLNIEIDRIKHCGEDPSYDLILNWSHKEEEKNNKTLCFDKEEVIEKVAAFIAESFQKD